jgi:TolB-like protein/tetratricopeptide (TPR) repeat protein
MSPDPDQEYFADGIVEDIITELSRAKWLFVIARNSSFTYKGRAVDVKQVGRELGVRYVLEGSVRRAADRIRINGQLIDAATGAHLWADRFEGDMADVFDLQDQVTRSVVGAIAPRLEQAEIDRAKRKPTESLDAYDHYLRGMAAFHAFTRSGNAEAVAHFSRALELDPGYAASSGMAARCYAQRNGFGWVVDRDQERAECQRLARIATTLGRDDAIALAAGGFALVMTGEVPDGDAFLDQALVVNPNLAWAWHISGFSKALAGQPEVAVKRATHAMRLSPHDPQFFAMRAVVALGDYLAGRYDAAYPGAEAALREKPNFLIAAGTAAASAALTRRPDEAARAMARLRQLNPDLRLSNLGDWLAFQRPEDADAWAAGLRKSGLPE